MTNALFYITKNAKSETGKFYLINPTVDNPQSIDDLALSVNFSNSDDKDLLRDIILKVDNIIESGKKGDRYVANKEDKDKEYFCSFSWSKDSIGNDVKVEKDFYNCSITSWENSEVKAIANCISFKHAIQNIAKNIKGE